MTESSSPRIKFSLRFGGSEVRGFSRLVRGSLGRTAVGRDWARIQVSLQARDGADCAVG